MGFAQEKANIVGSVSDLDSDGAPLAYASVTVKGTTNSTTTDDSGAYALTVDPGTLTLVFDFVGYESKEIEVTIAAGETQTVNQEMGSSSTELDNVVIETTINREKESALLAQQKDAVEMKQAIGAQELSRKGIGDAATAVTKTTGVSKQEGVNNVFVRGLGDRYNSTTLNGLPLPSEDPEYKNISLEFFSSNIIKNININKTFSAALYGDVAGANIDIASKEADKNAYFSASVGSGINTNAQGANFLVADNTFNYFGFLKNGKDVPINDLNVYNFDTDFKPEQHSNTINTDFNLIGGGRINFGENTLSLSGVIMSKTDYQYKEGNVSQVNPQAMYLQDLDFKRSEYKASQAMLFSAKYKYAKGSVAVNSLYIHDNTQSVGDYTGFARNVNDNDFATNSFIRRQQVNNNNLFTNQLLADYKFSDKFTLDFRGAYNMIRGSEPDRKTNSYDYDYDNTAGGGRILATNSSATNNRWFSTLEENDLVGKLEGRYTFNPEENLLKTLTFGADARNTKRTFEYNQFNYDFDGETPIDMNNPEGVFNQANLDLGKQNGGFDLETIRGSNNATAFDPYYYIGKRNIIAGYAQIAYPFSEKFVAQAGVRFENFKQDVDWDTNLTSSINNPAIQPTRIDKNYVLPSLTLKYSFTEKDALRFAASQTYTMPQFKETAPFLYEDVNFTSVGNPKLLPSENYNFDLKYDYYLSTREIVSFGLVYKYIDNPISRIRVLSAANDLSYVNTDHATVAGIEVEVRKNLYSVESDTRTNELSFGLNGSYLHTNQVQNDVDTDDFAVQFTNKEGKMQGAAPILLNSDLSYYASNDNTSLTSTLVYGYFNEKVFSVGTGGPGGNENIMEKSVSTLDFVNKFQFKKSNLGISLSAKNILDPKYRLTQKTTTAAGVTDDTLISVYRKGVFFSLGLSWTL